MNLKTKCGFSTEYTLECASLMLDKRYSHRATSGMNASIVVLSPN